VRGFGASRPDADEILPGLLIGSAPGRRQRHALVRAGVGFVVDLRAEATGVSEQWPQTVMVRHAPIVDRDAPAPELLDDLAGRIIDAIREGGTVLVHCHAGQGRAATVGCATLMRLGYDLVAAYRLLRDRRPVVSPTGRQLEALRGYAARLSEEQPSSNQPAQREGSTCQ
jgi:protein-tyrosine phosphatase